MPVAERPTNYQQIISTQEKLFLDPTYQLEHDIDLIYNKNVIRVGSEEGVEKYFNPRIRKNTVAIVGAMMGDEGKGRIVDNKISALLGIKGVNLVHVIRFQGGNNAGHTVEDEYRKIAGHLVPSFYLHEEAIGIIDQGVVVHPDLAVEVNYIEDAVGDLTNKLVVSEQAIFATDLERAEEGLNKMKSHGKTDGGTGRGIGPAYGHHTDRSGETLDSLMDENWKENCSKRYDKYKKDFAAWGLDLENSLVPDFEKTHRLGDQEYKRTVGTKAEFLDRLSLFRDFLLKRNMVKNTYHIHKKAYQDSSVAYLFEGAQAAGLDVWLGTRPDVTSSNTSVYGTREGTAIFTSDNIDEKIGVFKLTYTSDVGSNRRLPTKIDLNDEILKQEDLPEDATFDQKYAAQIREDYHEFGTTTGRARTIDYLDLEMMRYNVRMSGIEALVATHLDSAIEGRPIKVCSHYTDKNGKVLDYQPGLKYLEGVVPQYVELPGWNGKECQKAKSFDDLPDNAKKYLTFIQARVGVAILAATSGPQRDNLITFSGYNNTQKTA